MKTREKQPPFIIIIILSTHTDDFTKKSFSSLLWEMHYKQQLFELFILIRTQIIKGQTALLIYLFIFVISIPT